MLTLIEIAMKWNCTIRTVQRTLRRYKVTPSRFEGCRQLYAPEDVLVAETKEYTRKLKSARFELPQEQERERVLTVRQAKAAVRKGVAL